MNVNVHLYKIAKRSFFKNKIERTKERMTVKKDYDRDGMTEIYSDRGKEIWERERERAK